MKKFLTKSLILFLLVFGPLYPLAKYYDSRMPFNTSEKAIWITNQKETDYDYAVIGSSRAFNVISITKMDSVLSMKGINLGVSGAAFAENLLLLDQFYRNGNSLDVLMIQVDMWGIINPDTAYTHEFNDQNYLHLTGEPLVDSIMYQKINPVKYFMRKTIPFFKYAEYNNVYTPAKILSGFEHSPEAFESKKKNKSAIVEPKKAGYYLYDEKSAEWLEAIIRLARKNGTQVLLFTSPTERNYCNSLADNSALQDSINSLAGKLSVPFHNFEKDTICLQKNYFRDGVHLNKTGGDVFSVLLADYMRKEILPVKN
jgi:hypothetical protein